MWTFYVILALWIQSSAAQQREYITSGRSGLGEISAVYPEFYNNNSINENKLTDSSQLPARTDNTNLRDSFDNAYGLAQNHLISPTKKANNNPLQNINTHNGNNLSTRSPIMVANSITTQRSTAWKIPHGDSFNAKLFATISSAAQDQNLIYSPISMQTILTFIFSMSSDRLYDELGQLLGISYDWSVAKTFENLLQTTAFNSPNTTLIMANKLYYDYRFGPVDVNFRNFVNKSFNSEMAQINFLSPQKAASIVNLWVSKRTHNLIQEIVTPASISSDTSALLLNTLYFKSEWLTKFSLEDTETQEFFQTKRIKVPVNMMYNEDIFRYGDFSDDLQASVVELPYKAENLSMLLILPNDIEGLAELERKLRFADFESISEKLKRQKVIVKLPRFQIEYEIDMVQPLQQMGLYALFNNAGNINLFKTQQKPLKIDQFMHKSIIHVNEAGTEAAATTVAKYIPLSLPIDLKYFVADHPFVFVIRDTTTTFFIGHVVKF